MPTAPPVTETGYRWRKGDVFVSGGNHRWKVDQVFGDRAVLRSCASSWATTNLLTFDEWNEGGQWTLERPNQ